MATEPAVLALLDAYQNAINTKDARAVVACYTHDVVAYDLAPPLSQKADIVRDPTHVQEWFDSWEGPLESAAQETNLRVGADIAFVFSLRRMRGIKKTGQKVELWFRSTTICTRQAGEWKICHIHNSTPFAMDGSGKALLDLKP